jgi:hypothetical protein
MPILEATGVLVMDEIGQLLNQHEFILKITY